MQILKKIEKFKKKFCIKQYFLGVGLGSPEGTTWREHAHLTTSQRLQASKRGAMLHVLTMSPYNTTRCCSRKTNKMKPNNTAGYIKKIERKNKNQKKLNFLYF